MDKLELIKKLNDENIDPQAYCLEGGLPSEQYCLDRNLNGDKWYVYYSERGHRSGLKEFDNEQDACKYFYNSIVQDPTVYLK